MGVLVTVIGIVIALISILVVAFPHLPLLAIGRIENFATVRVTASLARIAVGIVLIVGSYYTDYQMVVMVIGWFSFAAGFLFLLMSTDRFKSILDWFVARLTPSMLRVGGLVGVGLGVALVLASV